MIEPSETFSNVTSIVAVLSIEMWRGILAMKTWSCEWEDAVDAARVSYVPLAVASALSLSLAFYRG